MRRFDYSFLDNGLLPANLTNLTALIYSFKTSANIRKEEFYKIYTELEKVAILPMGYVRGGAKSHGRNNRIEGVVKEGMKVVVVEDLISTGGSSLECVEALREAGCEVLGLIAIFTYGLDKATVNFENAHCPFVTLSNYDTLIEVAKEHDYIKHEDMEKLKAWKVDPSDESWMNK